MTILSTILIGNPQNTELYVKLLCDYMDVNNNNFFLTEFQISFIIFRYSTKLMKIVILQFVY